MEALPDPIYKVKFSLPPAPPGTAGRELSVTIHGLASVERGYPADTVKTDDWEFGPNDAVTAVLVDVGADGKRSEPTKPFHFALYEAQGTHHAALEHPDLERVGIADIAKFPE